MKQIGLRLVQQMVNKEFNEAKYTTHYIQIAALGLFFLTCCYTHGQEFDKAVVTDVNFLLRKGIFSNNIAFPFYFHYPEFIKDVHGDIREHCRNKFGVDTVIFSQPDSIFYYEYWTALKTHAKEKASSCQEGGSVFISVETQIHEVALYSGIYIYNFTSRIKAYTTGGKKVYSFTNIIPFEIWQENEEIYGKAQMKEEDFYAFYFDGLQLAFEGQTKKAQKRHLSQIPTDHYNDFLLQAEKFYLSNPIKGFSYGKDMGEQKCIISFDYEFWKELGFAEDWSEIYSKKQALEGYKINNNFENEVYNISFQEDENDKSNPIKIYPDIHFIIKDTAKKVIGDFMFKDNYKLHGIYKNNEYTVKWSAEYGIAEIITNDEIIVLMKMLDGRSIMWVKSDMEEELLGHIFNIIYVYNLSILAIPYL